MEPRQRCEVNWTSIKSRFFIMLCCLLLLPAFACAETLKLDIQGVDGELKAILETALVLPASMQDTASLNKRWLKHYQRQVAKLVSSTLEPYGYFNTQTDSQLLEEEPGHYLLRVNIRTAEAQRITALKLDLSGPGADLPELTKLANEFPLNQGDILRQDIYEQGKAALKQGAVNLGYLDADFVEHQIQVQLQQRRAAINLKLDTGVRYRFGLTLFEGRGSYPERFLRRYLAYSENDIFSYRQLGQTQLNFINADLFRSVNVYALDKQRSGDRVPVQVALVPAPRHRFRPGIGYGTDTGARVSLNYRNLNLLRRGHELQGDLSLAEREQSISTTYIIPDQDRLDSRTLLRVGVNREDTDSYISRKLFSEAEYQRSLGQRLSASVFVRLTQEYSNIADEKTRAQMLLPGVRLIWRDIDNSLRPRRGTQFQVELQGAEATLLSDTSLLQLSAGGTHLVPLPRNFSLLVRLQGGTTWHNDPLSELPASLRFFAGGDRSVRGYKYHSLGPKDSDGEVIGGKHLLVASAELEKQFTENWGAAIFYDVGNAFDNFAAYELEQGAGIGIRRYTKIGAIRIDLARQIGTDGNHYRVHLNVGIGW